MKKSQQEFKIGDYLIAIDNCYKHACAFDVGAIAKIYRIDSDYVYVKWIARSNGQNDGGYYREYFEVIPERAVLAYLI